MTIKVFVRSRFHFSAGEDWTELSIEGDAEDAVANIITATLLHARYEVRQLDTESEESESFGDPFDETP